MKVQRKFQKWWRQWRQWRHNNKKVNDDIADIDLINYTSSSCVSTNVSTNARGGDNPLL
jgi:hypothetical protein